MKALLISADSQSIDEVNVEGHDDITRLIGFDTLESDEVGSEGDRLFFDEECFIRGHTGRFQIDTMIPVSGKGLVIGTENDGSSLRDAVMDIDTLKNRIKYL